MRLYYKIKNFICNIWYDLRCRCQRFKRGYAYSDVWDMFDWFVQTIRPMLIHLRDYGFGVPCDLYDDEGVLWKDTLTEMINCLDMMDESKVYKYFGFGEFGSWKRMTKEDYENIHKTMEENKNRFFELFSKYFYNLWD